MNLVTEYNHAVAPANVSQPQQLLPAPHTPYRVVRTAQQKEFDIILLDLALEIRKIYFIVPSLFIQYQITGDEPAAIVRDDLAKRVIHRLLNEHSIPRFGEGLHCNSDGEHHARRFLQPPWLNPPAVMELHPLLHRSKIRIVRFGISVNGMLRLPDEGILNIG